MTSPSNTSGLARWVDYFKSVRSRIHVDSGFFKGAFSVAKIYTYFLSKKIGRTFGNKTNQKTIAFFPQPAGPWYNVWMTTQILKLKTTSDIDAADYVFVFDDFTESEVAVSLSDDNLAKAINHKVRDISKRNVGEIFEGVFGYAIEVDPLTHTGLAVRKSDLNGTHDGVIVECPIQPEDVIAGQAYQRLIDSTFNGKTAEDLRIACTFGKVAAVFHKHKDLDARFGTTYLSTDIRSAEDVFSTEELSLISEFCEKIGLDYGAIDVMRDKHDGRIYIVDVNKTCMPVLSLTLKNQIKAQYLVATAFQEGLAKIDAAL
ncbi:MAG: hypothetical protein HKO02_01300 [Hyphomonadaceae bacterium]|nr:hypothetical protein [Hyphomonadaceae bacterium]